MRDVSAELDKPAMMVECYLTNLVKRSISDVLGLSRRLTDDFRNGFTSLQPIVCPLHLLFILLRILLDKLSNAVLFTLCLRIAQSEVAIAHYLVSMLNVPTFCLLYLNAIRLFIHFIFRSITSTTKSSVILWKFHTKVLWPYWMKRALTSERLPIRLIYLIFPRMTFNKTCKKIIASNYVHLTSYIKICGISSVLWKCCLEVR